MMHSPLISIITPTFNAGASIGSTVTSVREQVYGNVEHIIADGASTDNTHEILGNFKGETNHLRWFTEKDHGIYDAMNKAILLSNGEYLLFLGSGDRFFNDGVLDEIVRSGILRKKMIVYGNVKIVGDTGWARDGDIYNGPFSKKKLMRKNICHQAILYPRWMFERYGNYDVRYRINADWDLNLRFRSKHCFLYADKIITVFYGGGSSTGSTDEQFKQEYGEKLREYYGLAEREIKWLLRHSPWGDLICDSHSSGGVEKPTFLMRVWNQVQERRYQ